MKKNRGQMSEESWAPAHPPAVLSAGARAGYGGAPGSCAPVKIYFFILYPFLSRQVDSHSFDTTFDT